MTDSRTPAGHGRRALSALLTLGLALPMTACGDDAPPPPPPMRPVTYVTLQTSTPESSQLLDENAELDAMKVTFPPSAGPSPPVMLDAGA